MIDRDYKIKGLRFPSFYIKDFEIALSFYTNVCGQLPQTGSYLDVLQDAVLQR